MFQLCVTAILKAQRWWDFSILMFVGGFYGAFPHTIRRGLLQCINCRFLLFAMALGDIHQGKSILDCLVATVLRVGGFFARSLEKRCEGIRKSLPKGDFNI